MSKMKAGFGGGKGMNGTRMSKGAAGATKAGWSKAGTGTKGAANKGYK